ncbi:hypothetical protein LZZ85_04365 [Terrimonas sp. NA20]|uniref:Uncharacterized protein n=1 Tax=Terrimonas ginsenosidimutans TaxID=2908004 RepID=A0ABS9KME6_9BACT|nr:hypothetical protein [Terrimonas ginsenosidimutans]MCG2613498.1 hypothetical protein [Terrimonas ginsenosidimutans]
MSARDFQLAIASLIASPETCCEILTEEEPFFTRFSLTEKEKLRLHGIVRQRGISACCSLYRMNRITPVYSQLSNTCMLLKDELVPLVEEFWLHLTKPSLQFKEEVLEFGAFLTNKISTGAICQPYLKEVLQLEIAMNELSYLPEGEHRILTFEHDIFFVLRALADGSLDDADVPPSVCRYKIYINNDKVEMEPAEAE